MPRTGRGMFNAWLGATCQRKTDISANWDEACAFLIPPPYAIRKVNHDTIARPRHYCLPSRPNSGTSHDPSSPCAVISRPFILTHLPPPVTGNQTYSTNTTLSQPVTLSYSPVSTKVVCTTFFAPAAADRCKIVRSNKKGLRKVVNRLPMHFILFPRASSRYCKNKCVVSVLHINSMTNILPWKVGYPVKYAAVCGRFVKLFEISRDDSSLVGRMWVDGLLAD